MYLNNHSYYSLKYGTLSPQQLAAAAAQNGVKRMVLTDINNTSCAYAFIKACRSFSIEPVLGIEFRKFHREDSPSAMGGVKDGELLYIGIAKNAEGWRELTALLTDCSLDKKQLPKEAPEFKNCYVVYRKLPKGIHHLRDNEFVGVRPTEVNKLYSSYLKDFPNKLVVFAPVTFLNEDGYKVHKLLRCIDLNIVLGKLDPKHCANASEYFYTEDQLRKIFSQYPHIIENTETLLDQCSIEMPSTKNNNRRTFTGTEEGDMKLLYKLAINGCIRRYGEGDKEAMRRTLKEI